MSPLRWLPLSFLAISMFGIALPLMAQAPDPKQDFLYRAYLGFTILGVVVGLAGLYIIYGQTKSTATAATAAA